MKLVNQSKILMHLKMFLIMKLRLLWSFGYYHFHNFLRATHYLGIKRDDSAFIDQQGKNYLNYLISYLIYTIIASVLVFVLIGVVLLFILGIAMIIYSIVAIIFVLKGEDYVVPFTIEFIK